VKDISLPHLASQTYQNHLLLLPHPKLDVFKTMKMTWNQRV